MHGQALLTRETELATSAVLAGELDAEVENAVRVHSRLVYRIAFSVLRRPSDAEDATQEVFLRVHRFRSRLSGVRDMKTYLARIAWRVALDRRPRLTAVSLDDADGAAARGLRSLAGARKSSPRKPTSGGSWNASSELRRQSRRGGAVLPPLPSSGLSFPLLRRSAKRIGSSSPTSP